MRKIELKSINERQVNVKPGVFLSYPKKLLKYKHTFRDIVTSVHYDSIVI